jgi:hypothetical protein
VIGDESEGYKNGKVVNRDELEGYKEWQVCDQGRTGGL